MSLSPIGPEELRQQRERLYQEMPAEVSALERRRGVMQPAGPLLYAEAESRLLHEQLSLLVLAVEAEQLDLERAIPSLRFLLDRAAVRLGGWYLLHDAADLVARVSVSIESLDSAARLALLRELVYYVGRLNYWLDLTIPWNDVNELMRATSGANVTLDSGEEVARG